MKLSQAAVTKLVEQIGDLRKPPGPPEPGLTVTERKFYDAAIHGKGARVWRNGWPDFLVDLPGMGHVGIEIKSGSDQLKWYQREMFAALESAGILKVYVWHPKYPDRLTPWRKFGGTKAAQFAARNGMSIADGKLALSSANKAAWRGLPGERRQEPR